MVSLIFLIFPVSICDSNVPAVVFVETQVYFCLHTHRKSAALQSSMRLFPAFVSVSGSETKSPYRSPRLLTAFTDPLVIKSILLKKHFVEELLLNNVKCDT